MKPIQKIIPKKLQSNKKGVVVTLLLVVLVLLALAVIATVVFRDWIPGLVTVAAQLGIIDMKAPPQADFTAATLATHKNVVEEYLQRIGDDLTVEIVLKGEIHRSGIIGETCYVCSDYTFLVHKKIPFKDLKRGIHTHRVTARDVVGGAEETNLNGLDEVAIDTINVFVKNSKSGYALKKEDTWNVHLPILDEQGNTKYDARSNKALYLLLTTVTDVQFHNREVQFTVKPAYTYQGKKKEEDPNV